MKKQILDLGKAFTVAVGVSSVMTSILQACERTEISWYGGEEFNGNKTANGETFNDQAMTAAHKTLPFGTRIKVTNEANGRSLILTVNDRGPFHPRREVDVTKQAAAILGFENKGITQGTYCPL